MPKRRIAEAPAVGATGNGGSFWDTGADAAVDDGFDEHAYLNANPDVAIAILSGSVGSAREHFESWGRSEGRDLIFGAGDQRDNLILTQGGQRVLQSPMRHSAEAVIVSKSGGVLILGWIDDANRP